jgi:hypothetical protein
MTFQSTRPAREQTALSVTLIAIVCLSCSDDDGPVTCTTELRTSVVVKVLDVAGAVVTDATVKYSLDGANSEACQQVLDGYSCGYEAPGNFVIAAARNNEVGLTAVTVERAPKPDHCHVVTKTVEVVIAP